MSSTKKHNTTISSADLSSDELLTINSTDSLYSINMPSEQDDSANIKNNEDLQTINNYIDKKNKHLAKDTNEYKYYAESNDNNIESKDLINSLDNFSIDESEESKMQKIKYIQSPKYMNKNNVANNSSDIYYDKNNFNEEYFSKDSLLLEPNAIDNDIFSADRVALNMEIERRIRMNASGYTDGKDLWNTDELIDYNSEDYVDLKNKIFGETLRLFNENDDTQQSQFNVEEKRMPKTVYIDPKKVAQENPELNNQLKKDDLTSITNITNEQKIDNFVKNFNDENALSDKMTSVQAKSVNLNENFYVSNDKLNSGSYTNSIVYTEPSNEDKKYIREDSYGYKVIEKQNLDKIHSLEDILKNLTNELLSVNSIAKKKPDSEKLNESKVDEAQENNENKELELKQDDSNKNEIIDQINDDKVIDKFTDKKIDSSQLNNNEKFKNIDRMSKPSNLTGFAFRSSDNSLYNNYTRQNIANMQNPFLNFDKKPLISDADKKYNSTNDDKPVGTMSNDIDDKK